MDPTESDQTEQQPQDTEPQGQQQAESPEGAADGGDGIVDSHGQPGISRDKYAREMKAKDDKIAELQAKVDEASKAEESRKGLNDEIAKLRRELEDDRVSHALEMAGCRSVKAAKALLGDYGGDVAKLKEAEPYLFGDGRPSGSTGLKPEGAASGKEAEEEARMRRVAGLPPKQ